ncbi:MAG: tetrahydrodipicolinate N-succinyltransferase N-terminal domain-containing protein, partial [Brooklawnia sp.]
MTAQELFDNDPTTAPGMSAWGWGLASVHVSGQILDVWYPEPRLGPADADSQPQAMLRAHRIADETRGITTEIVRTTVELDSPPTSTMDAYLRLHLLSHRLRKPRSINLDGIFGVLPNVVWTTAGPCHAETFETIRATLRGLRGGLNVVSVDKFPRMVDYIIPSGVRIGDAARIRL